ncbi:hypothetical protein MLD38_014722 [Melastoma candidum]|uniref:Uncharacterized protein n=1 Tax=Melastoma candidum TaxID=119954 RepID=A0ACB9RD23_9MYRT|nr:hypothetical protein MLD38_014722 [Melastoma candidum]
MEERTASFSGYGKCHEQEEDPSIYWKPARRRLIIILISGVVLVLLVVGMTVGIVFSKEPGDGNQEPKTSHEAESVTAVCKVTRYPDSCITSISRMSDSPGAASQDPSVEEIFVLSLQVALTELRNLSVHIPRSFYDDESDSPLEQSSLMDCQVLIRDAIDQVRECIACAPEGHEARSAIISNVSKIRTWLSAAITDQNTCLYGIKEAVTESSAFLTNMSSTMKDSLEYTSNSLAIATNIFAVLNDLGVANQKTRRLLDDSGKGSAIRKIPSNPKPDITVAKDGSGDFRTIAEAVMAVPSTSENRTVIYIKKGVYVENVTIGCDCWNLMMYGDGMNKTIVSFAMNHVDGFTTYSTATFAVNGRGFVAKDMGFRNTAGPEKLQAVALRSSADQSVFYRCFIDGYQDTLYAHTGRQFYGGCLITGTVDFIFGNAAVVFQNCSIRPRQPLTGQFNTVTAQGKSDPNQNTGIVIQRSQVTPLGKVTADSYLGRPWQDFSTTVFVHSNMDRIVEPAGWARWDPRKDPPSTIFYAEHENVGAGSETLHRVKWPGYKRNITEHQASRFGVDAFIQGSSWLSQANVQFDSSY